MLPMQRCKGVWPSPAIYQRRKGSHWPWPAVSNRTQTKPDQPRTEPRPSDQPKPDHLQPAPVSREYSSTHAVTRPMSITSRLLSRCLQRPAERYSLLGPDTGDVNRVIIYSYVYTPRGKTDHAIANAKWLTREDLTSDPGVNRLSCYWRSRGSFQNTQGGNADRPVWRCRGSTSSRQTADTAIFSPADFWKTWIER